MSVRSYKFTVVCLEMLSVISFYLVGCSNLNNKSSFFHFINKSNRDIVFRDVLTIPMLRVDYKMILNTHSVKAISTTSKSKIKSIQQTENDTISQSIKNGHIVYSRKYKNIPKGSYTGNSSYIVKRGDTLFYIAWITGNNLKSLAQQNNISAPYRLNVGQKLQIKKMENISFKSNDIISITGITSKNNSLQSTQKAKMLAFSKTPISNSDIASTKNINQHTSTIVSAPSVPPTTFIINRPKSTNTHSISSNLPILNWCWPTNGKIIENFSFLGGGNKGIDIAGKKGRAIVAATDGFVVYAGNALRGYGNLIIIKHDKDYLSAYAHNDMILVQEQQKVKAGQKIATMGSTGTSSTRLHFEIRYKGKSVNPLKYLPQR